MMQDLAMHILDIAYNSIRAQASEITVTYRDSTIANKITITIQDNGCGLSELQIQQVTNPFYTTRTTRRVGMGVALFQGLAQQCDGQFSLTSQVNLGTTIQVSVRKDHWDTPPQGDLAQTMQTLIQADPTIHFQFNMVLDTKTFTFDTKEIQAILTDEVSLSEPTILLWIQEYIHQGISELTK